MCNCGLKFPKGSRFLITGGAGFIGSNLVRRILELGHEAIVLDNFSSGREENIKEFRSQSGFSFIEGDIRCLEVCQKVCKDVDFVLHQAALSSVPHSIEDPIATNDSNVTGTLNMLIASRDNNVKRFIFASSSSVYGDAAELPKREDKLGKQLSPYAISKLTGELYGRIFFNLYGLPVIGLRYFNVFGKNQNPHTAYAAVIPKFTEMLLNGESPIIYGDGEQSRDFTCVENIVEANLKACLSETGALGEVFNIGNGERITINDLYSKLRDLLKADRDPIYGPERNGDIKHSSADISKAKEILGYIPVYSFDEGISMYVDWYKNHLL